MQTRNRSTYSTIHTEGALLPPDLLQRIQAGDGDLDGLAPADYHLDPGVRLNEATNRAWNRLLGAWENFSTARENLPADDPGTTATRERWLLPLFQELGYGRLQTSRAIRIDDSPAGGARDYPISHDWNEVPIHLLGCKIDLDRRTAGVAGAAQTSPHSLVQELLNRSEHHLWAFVSNGLRLRILRDNVSLTRQAYVEFDLEAMLEGETYADFVVLWLVCHQSRVEAGRPEEFQLEKWSQHARERGTRALEDLRTGVEKAITALGGGFLVHPANADLKDRLRRGDLTGQDYYRQLLRIVYRLIFLFVAEDRGLLLDPGAGREAMERYDRFYSTARLRELAERRGSPRHHDLFVALRLVMELLSGEGDPARAVGLGLPVLGSFLFSREAVADVISCELPNAALLECVRTLAYTEDQRALRPVDYKNLGPEELGSVYESLLELHPELNVDSGSFSLVTARGHKRKETGSYYTPSSLIQVLLDSALDPVVEDRLNAVRGAPLAEQEAALLDIKVCDPACGSGHFLIAAAHRLAKRLAALRTAAGEPPPEAVRSALRDVIARCLYGVDVNPDAVELCKVGLWMEALEPSKPLSFLDAHIKCGNSLIGAGRIRSDSEGPGMEIEEIPDDAFQPAFGDDRSTATALRRRNKRERAGQMAFAFGERRVRDAEDHIHWVVRQAGVLETLPEDSVRQVSEKATAYQALLTNPQYQSKKLEYDLWTAAFFWPVPQGDAEAMLAPSHEALRRLRMGKPLDPELVELVQEIAGELRFFHWELEFPTVFLGAVDVGEGRDGFDAILGNPPWERIKLQEQEFFAGRDPAIAAAPTKAARERLIKRLPEEDPGLWRQFVRAKAAAENGSHFVRNSWRYPLTAVGDVNTYALFAEHVRHILGGRGRAGIIVPTGIATDHTTREFFEDLIENQALVSLFDFFNQLRLFPSVAPVLKFCLLVISSLPINSADFIFFATKVSDLTDVVRRFSLTAKEITLFNPNTRTMPVFRTRPDAELTREIYQRVPVLENEVTGENPWGIRFMTMFHMSNDSHLFATEPRPGYVPLYEGKLFHKFDHRLNTFEGTDSKNRFKMKAATVGISKREKQDPSKVPIPRFWVPYSEVKERIPGNWKRNWVLGFRNTVQMMTNTNCAVFTILPISGIGNSAPLLFPTTEARLAGLLLANVNSLPFEFSLIQKIGGGNLNFFIVKQLPVLVPKEYGQSDLTFLVPRVLELVYTAWDLQSFAIDMGISLPPYRWVPNRRRLIRAEIDAYYVHLYGLNRKQLRYILDPADLTPTELEDILDPWEEVADPLDPEGSARRAAASTFPGETFRVLKEKEIRLHGEYRTRRLVLTAWERLAAVDFDVERYLPMTDPPAADPSMAHPAREEGVRYEALLDEELVVAEKAGGYMAEGYAADPEISDEAFVESESEETHWGMYRCGVCGQVAMGFAREEHAKKEHRGLKVSWERVGG